MDSKEFKKQINIINYCNKKLNEILEILKQDPKNKLGYMIEPLEVEREDAIQTILYLLKKNEYSCTQQNQRNSGAEDLKQLE